MTNVQQRAISLAARSTDDANASTKFDIDNGSAKLTRAVALIGTNLSQAALVKVSWGTTLGGAEVATSGWVSAFAVPVAYGGIEWPASGSLGAEFIVYVATTPAASARYIRVEIDDTANADGYVQIGRLWVGDGFEPTYNAVYGMERGWDDFSTLDTNVAGSLAAHKRRPRRTTKFALELMSVAEGHTLTELMRRQGLVDEVLYLPDLARRDDSQRYGFVARLKALQNIVLPSYLRRSTLVELIEVV